MFNRNLSAIPIELEPEIDYRNKLPKEPNIIGEFSVEMGADNKGTLNKDIATILNTVGYKVIGHHIKTERIEHGAMPTTYRHYYQYTTNASLEVINKIEAQLQKPYTGFENYKKDRKQAIKIAQSFYAQVTKGVIEVNPEAPIKLFTDRAKGEAYAEIHNLRFMYNAKGEVAVGTDKQLDDWDASDEGTRWHYTYPEEIEPEVKPELNPIFKELEPLTEEARKYKSTEEFVNKVLRQEERYYSFPEKIQKEAGHFYRIESGEFKIVPIVSPIPTRKWVIEFKPKETEISEILLGGDTRKELVKKFPKVLTDFYAQATKEVKNPQGSNMKKQIAAQERNYAFELGYKYGRKEAKYLEEIYTSKYFRERQPFINLFVDDFRDLADMRFKGIRSNKTIADVLYDKGDYISYHEMWFHFREGYYQAIDNCLNDIIDEFYNQPLDRRNNLIDY